MMKISDNRQLKMYNRKTIARIIIITVFVTSISCSVINNPNKPRFSFMAGISHGGIVENTDMNVVPNAITPPEATVDAFTGATNIGFNAGVHVNKRVGKNEIETGMDYLFTHHEFNYIDIGNMNIGVRRLSLSQLMVPFTWNLMMIRKIELQLKLGLVAQYNLVGVNDVTVFHLPDYRIHPFSAGPALGISAFPVKFRNGNKLGFYLDIYRGSRIYEDFYNQNSFEMPGSSYVKSGFKLQF